MSKVKLELTIDDIEVLLEALEEAEYWAKGTHGDPGLPVNNGYVWLPGDDQGEVDRYWPDPPTEEEEGAIVEVQAMRALGMRLRAQLVRHVEEGRA